MIWVLFLLAAGRIRVAPPQIDTARILWIGAHPDDESTVAPFLGASCVDGTSQCKILVLTRGENGGDPDVRAGELRAAAALLHADLEQWDFADTMNPAADWDHAALVARLRDAIARYAPTMILTFDPVHGTTCHPAHRAIAPLVIEVVGTKDLFFSEMRATPQLALSIGIDSASRRFQGNLPWHFLIDDLRAHASQFTPEQVDALAANEVPIVLIPATATATYNAPCQ
jgi:LmbE family N-acetylglucosaminyl deacetylase